VPLLRKCAGRPTVISTSAGLLPSAQQQAYCCQHSSRPTAVSTAAGLPFTKPQDSTKYSTHIRLQAYLWIITCYSQHYNNHLLQSALQQSLATVSTKIITCYSQHYNNHLLQSALQQSLATVSTTTITCYSQH